MSPQIDTAIEPEVLTIPVVVSVRATLTVLVNNSHSRSSQGISKVNIYARRGIVYNTCIARVNPKRTL
jgi:hypothetical protein